MHKPTSQIDLPVDPDHDHEHVDDDAENTAPVDSDVTDEPAENPIPAKKDEPAAPVAPTAPAPAGDDVAPKRSRGRPRKETAATPAKKDVPGADVAPKAAPRSEQVDQLRGLLQLRASAIGSMACQIAGWPMLTAEESALIDAEFEGWTPPAEIKKAVVLGIVVLPRAMADNRLRQMIGLGPVDGGDASGEARRQLAQQRAELERQQAEIAGQRAELQQQAQKQAQQPAPAPAAPAAAPAGKRKPAPEPEPEIKLVIPEGFL